MGIDNNQIIIEIVDANRAVELKRELESDGLINNKDFNYYAYLYRISIYIFYLIISCSPKPPGISKISEWLSSFSVKPATAGAKA